MRTPSLASTLRLIGGLALISFAACSATSPGNQFTGAGGGNSSSGGSGNGGPGSGGEIGFDAGLPPDGSVDDGGACAGETKKAEQLPLDMYIMLDQSGSMETSDTGSGSRWDAVTGAFKTFVNQPGTAGIGVGIQYFPIPPSASTCSPTCASDADCGGQFFTCLFGMCVNCDTNSCSAADYSKPDVEIAALPGVASAFTASIDKHGPTGGTPTSAALRGAIDHAKEWATTHPDHVVIDVLATDGAPGNCDTNQSHIDAIAAEGVNGTPKILTFVIGVGSALTALNGTAAAGGTGQAFFVDTNQNVNQQFLEALNKIRGAALSCSYLIPTPTVGMPNFDSVNVEYTPAGGTKQVIHKVKDKASCPISGGDAWFYDNNAKPTQILLCNGTCDKVSADTTGQIDIVLGCATVAQ